MATPWPHAGHTTTKHIPPAAASMPLTSRPDRAASGRRGAIHGLADAGHPWPAGGIHAANPRRIHAAHAPSLATRSAASMPLFPLPRRPAPAPLAEGGQGAGVLPLALRVCAASMPRLAGHPGVRSARPSLAALKSGGAGKLDYIYMHRRIMRVIRRCSGGRRSAWSRNAARPGSVAPHCSGRHQRPTRCRLKFRSI
jgi:hypothetical protein